jgi:hypothetical protein
MNWKILLVVAIFFLQQQLLAQNGVLTFHTETYNLGRIAKTNQAITHQFIFQNTGTAPVNIIDVNVDCACMSAYFPTTPIQPNEQASIKVSFSPYRAGSFEKEFVVLTTATPKAYHLKLKGYLLPYMPEQTINDYVYEKGSLKFRQKSLNFGTITTQMTVTKKFSFYNASNKDITFTQNIKTPAHLKVFFDSSTTVKAGQFGQIVIQYDPKNKDNFGYLQDEVILHTNHKEKINITVAADVQPDTHVIAENSSATPNICVQEALYQIHNVSPQNDAYTEVEVRNVGNIPLKIHKIATAEGCEVLDDIEEIAPNTTKRIKVRLLHNGRAGSHDTFFTIYSNDPYKSKQIVSLKAHILPE